MRSPRAFAAKNNGRWRLPDIAPPFHSTYTRERFIQMVPFDPAPAVTSAPSDRAYLLERIDEAAVVQLYADGFPHLPLREKTLLWHLSRAAIAGRDIFYDQRYAHNLELRDLLEAIVGHGASIDPVTRAEIVRY